MGLRMGSTEDQELGLQIAALRSAGVPEANIVREKVSGKAGSDRPLYAGLLKRLKDNDCLVVWKVDRPGRSPWRSWTNPIARRRSAQPLSGTAKQSFLHLG